MDRTANTAHWRERIRPTHPMPVPRIPALLASLVIALWLVVPVGAQSLVINVDAGFGGYHRPGRWCPVIVTIDNQPESGSAADASLAFSGRLVIESKSYADRSSDMRFVRDVEVPAFSSQRFVVHAKFPETGLANPEVQIRSRTGRLVSRHPIAIQPLTKSQVLLVTASDRSISLALPNTRWQVLNPLLQSQMTARGLFTSWVGYDSVDVLVLPSWPEAQVSPDRVQALRDWVAMGGTLVLLGGSQTPSYAGDPLARALLPVDLDGSGLFSFDASGRVAVAEDGVPAAGDGRGIILSRATPKQGTEVIAGTEDVPLLVREGHGLGQVVFAAADFQDRSAEWRELFSRGWMALLPMPDTLHWSHAIHEHLGGETLVTGAAARPPNVALIILICVVYTLLVGPVNFYVLSRRNRIQWAWLTVPVIVLVFSGLIYGIGAVTKGGTRIARETVLLTSVEGQRTFAQRSYVSLFTPSAGNFHARPGSVALAAGASARWHEIEAVRDGIGLSLGAPPSGLAIMSDLPEIATPEDNEVHVERWPLRTFDTTTFEVTGPYTAQGAITSGIRIQPAGGRETAFQLEGDVRNGTEFEFQYACLAVGTRALPLGPFAPGETVSLVPSETRIGVRNVGTTFGRAWVEMDLFLADIVSENEGESDQAIALRNGARMVQSMYYPHEAALVFPSMNGPIAFVGIGVRQELSVDTGLQRDQGMAAIVARVELPLEAPAMPFTVPSEMVRVRLQDYSRDTLGFQVPGDGKPRLLMRRSSGLLGLETAFRDVDLRVSAIGTTILEDSASKRQDFASSLYFLGDRRPVQAGALRVDDPLDDAATPYNGRFWIQLDALEPRGQGPGLTLEDIEVSSMAFRVRVEPRAAP